MAKELVVLNNNVDTTPATYVEPIENENGNWGEEEAPRPEYIQLKQPSTTGADHVPMGHFFHKSSGQSWAEINLVPLQMYKGRQWKPSAPAFVEGEKVACRSNNRTLYTASPVLGNPSYNVQANDCMKCDQNSWKGYDKVTKLGSRPTCAKDFYFLYIDQETNLPYIYNPTGGSVDPCDAIYDVVKAQSLVAKGKYGRRPNTFEFLITMSSERSGKNYRPKFTSVRQLTPEDAAKFGPLFAQFVTNFKYQVADSAPEDDGSYDASEDTGQVLEGHKPVAI